MQELDALLRDKVKLLGNALGETIQQHHGDDMLNIIEAIRRQAKKAQNGDENDRLQLIEQLTELPEDALVPVVRGFNQFLNLANIAEQQHKTSWRRGDALVDDIELMFGRLLDRLEQSDNSHLNITQQVATAGIEVVLTAHPTEITRRTLIQKYDKISSLLQRRDDLHEDHPHGDQIDQHIRLLIEEIWHTDEIRKVRPTAVDEAKWGFAVLENSLWQAIPELIRSLDDELIARGHSPLPCNAAPVKFASWMGGDRDGNPNVTHSVTREVLLLARWMAADLYLRDLNVLGSQLSTSEATAEMQQAYGEQEPYRACIHNLRDQLLATKRWVQMQLPGADNSDELFTKNNPEFCVKPLLHESELLKPLELCYRSLTDVGLHQLANGRLLDMLRRIACFGHTLVKLDIRQESTRHTDVVADLCDFYGYGDYRNWSEEKKQTFLLAELASKRPLIPNNWQTSADNLEVLNTMSVIADTVGQGVSCYVISMASEPSDVLAVALLLQASGVVRKLPIVPLFETLSDLQLAAERMDTLWSIPWYRGYSKSHQQVMIGYSDSAKDAGQLAAVWAQYLAQESLARVAAAKGYQLQLFHGRGGSVGRGGYPAQRAILSQPPGSVSGGLRVTEQGEMIRFKFGLPEVAQRNLKVYISSVLEAKLLPPTPPKEEWRQAMSELTEKGVESYRAMVRGRDNFVEYFRAATPEQELGKLALGSRPARRKKGGGIASLRAIPWIFAWTQMRLMLPAWLGADEAFGDVMKDSKKLENLRNMYAEWPFFTTYIDMLEMVLSKADATISEFYEKQLVSPDLQYLGIELRQRLEKMVELVLRLKRQSMLIEDNIALQHSMRVRKTYSDPLHYIQAELLKRDRQSADDPQQKIEQALKVSMAGIAAGMRNTG